MKEIKILLNDVQLIEKQKHYVPEVEGGYFLELYFGSKRVTSKPFRVSNLKDTANIASQLSIFNICGNTLDFVLKAYKTYDFVASGQLQIEAIGDRDEVIISMVVEHVIFACLRFGIQVIQTVIAKEVVVEKEEDCFRPPEPEVDLEELRRKEEEEKQRIFEEQEALRRAELNKNPITYTNVKAKDAPYY